MSVLIKGMEMPKECRECMLSEYHDGTGKTWCKPADKLLANNRKPIMFDGRPDWCPIEELPEKHGRLIDADVLMDIFADRLAKAVRYGIDSAVAGAISGAMKLLDVQPTVIEAEGET